jgi:hypothetical protein
MRIPDSREMAHRREFDRRDERLSRAIFFVLGAVCGALAVLVSSMALL